MIYSPDRAFGMLSETDFVGINVAAAAYFFAAPFALALNYRRLTDVNDRRRIRVLVLGVAVGITRIGDRNDGNRCSAIKTGYVGPSYPGS